VLKEEAQGQNNPPIAQALALAIGPPITTNMEDLITEPMETALQSMELPFALIRMVKSHGL